MSRGAWMMRKDDDAGDGDGYIYTCIFIIYET